MKRVIKATVDLEGIKQNLYDAFFESKIVGNPEYDFMFEDHGEGPLKDRYQEAIDKWCKETAPKIAKKIESHADDSTYEYSDEFFDYQDSLMDGLLDELYDL